MTRLFEGDRRFPIISAVCHTSFIGLFILKLKLISSVNKFAAPPKNLRLK
jgi:hypothetical protein